LVVVEKEELVGIISERDYARKVDLQGKSSLNTPVKDIMTREVYCVRPEQTVEECMALMTNKHIRHLPVLSGNKLRGLVSIGDIVKAIISEQEFMIKQLENYIVTSSS
ncbi:MAG: CBS domain-containing protein, partial [Gammaproteobacteria bacterium]|nr:CBS domain-containing protein [Gammaproteobacteria bacterium]NIT41212.1 CBS domain-containing protein [Gammaproteobacteria bacterium]